jgi:hypothetical protein
VPRHIIGLDLGQTSDFTALAVLEKSPLLDPKGYLMRDNDGGLLDVYDCVHLGRYPLGTSYPAIVADVAALARRSELKPARRDSLALAIDQTGVGGAVVDMFRREKMPAEVVGVMITSGSGSRWEEGGKKAIVSKIELVGQVQSFLQTGRLKVVPSLKFASLLKTELLNFQVKITPAANETFGSWREGQHDDLVLAVAMAAWLGEHQVVQVVLATSRRFPTPASRDRPTRLRHWAARSIEQKIRFYR